MRFGRLLGLVQPLPFAGGRSGPSLLSRQQIDVAEKFIQQWIALDVIFRMKLKFDPGVICDVTGQVKQNV